MRHFLLAGTQVRVGVVAGFFCYQPFVSGRLGKAVQLFPAFISDERNAAYFEANFEPQVKENGDVLVVAKGEQHAKNNG
jgi:hypothetical protein